MFQTDATSYCANHPDRSAVARCDHCGRPFCEDCRVEDVAAEEMFCSRSRREEHSKSREGPALAADRTFLDGYQRPIRTGWLLWAHSLGALCAHTAPLAIAMGLMVWLSSEVDESGETRVSDTAAFVLLLGFGFGVALTQVILSRQYSGLIKGNVYLWTLRRFVPWALSLAIVFVITVLGMMAFLLPGMYLALRLFWADEFVLVHQSGPLRALRESWELTQGEAGPVFRFQFLAGLAAYLVFIGGAVVLAAVGTLGRLLASPRYWEPATFVCIWLVIFVGYGALHASEIVYLYGMRADRASSLAASTTTLLTDDVAPN